jgi:hypothetical protein
MAGDVQPHFQLPATQAFCLVLMPDRIIIELLSYSSAIFLDLQFAASRNKRLKHGNNGISLLPK